jgi:hypothetical protein
MAWRTRISRYRLVARDEANGHKGSLSACVLRGHSMLCPIVQSNCQKALNEAEINQDMNTAVKPLAVLPVGKLATTWGDIK